MVHGDPPRPEPGGQEPFGDHENEAKAARERGQVNFGDAVVYPSNPNSQILPDGDPENIGYRQGD